MKTNLNSSQRGYAKHRLLFIDDLLSLELAESLRRTCLACAENKKKQAGIVDVVCGLYLQDTEEMARYFKGDLPFVVGRIFPTHRFGRKGLFPKAMLDQLESESVEAENIGFSLDYGDDVLRLLW